MFGVYGSKFPAVGKVHTRRSHAI